jgi:hypothetical protein
MAEMHRFSVSESASHVPYKFQCFQAYIFALFFHAIYDLYDAIRVRGQEPDTKKRALSKVNIWSYLCWQLGQVIFNGLSSLTSLICAM